MVERVDECVLRVCGGVGDGWLGGDEGFFEDGEVVHLGEVEWVSGVGEE